MATKNQSVVAGGEVDVMKTKDGEFRFRYITPGGAEYVGPKLYKTERGAKSAGEKWLAHTAK